MSKYGIIKNARQVKYLGVILKDNLCYDAHIKNQIRKANYAFSLSNKLFCNKILLPRVKIIAYQALIRPILTYACATWYNIGPTLMEKYIVIERKCIRKCINMHRKPETEYTHYFSKKKIIQHS